MMKYQLEFDLKKEKQFKTKSVISWGVGVVFGMGDD